jgi:hypothetical protein
LPELESVDQRGHLKYKLETPIFKSVAEQKIARQEITKMVALLKEQLNRFEKIMNNYKAALAANSEGVVDALAKLTISLESINTNLPGLEDSPSNASGTANSTTAPAIDGDAIDSSDF